MATNQSLPNARWINLAVTAGVVSGDPVAVGNITGVAMYDRDSGGLSTIDTGGAYSLSVKGVDDDGNSAVAIGDLLYFNSADTPKLSKKSSGFLFGSALAVVVSGATTTISVKLLEASGGGGANVAALIDHLKTINVRNNTGSTITAGSPVYVNAWDETNKIFSVALADADAAGKAAQFVMPADLATATNGTAVKQFRLTGLNANTGTVGDPVYLSATAGAYTQTAPTAANAIAQVIGYLAVKSATVGEIEFDLALTRTPAIGSNELQALSVTNPAIGLLAVKAANIKFFKSTEQTGNGGAQNIAHGLGSVPGLVIVYPSDTAPATAGVYTMTEGAHDATNCVVTVTTSKKYFVVAVA